MNDSLLRLITADNPWLEDPARAPEVFARHLPDSWRPRRAAYTERWPISGKAHVVIGARQVGKSSLIWRWCQERGAPPLLLSAEEPAIQEWARQPALAAQDLSELVSPGTPILLEEAQHLGEAGLFVKGLIDRRLPNPLFVTGSSSFHLLARTRESLAGRAVRVRLPPLSLHELTLADTDDPPLIRRRRAREVARRMAVLGGYPEVWSSETPAVVLARLVDAFVMRDASDLFRIRNLGAFRKLLSLLAGQSGSLVNLTEWAGICGVSRPTIESYLEILVETHLAHALRPFVGGKRAELTGHAKVYLADNGVRNLIANALQAFDDRLDRGPLFESWVAAELMKHLDPLHPADTLHYWRSRAGAEVDFVLTRPDGLVGVEVKASAPPRPRLTRSARSFIDAYAPARFWIVNLDLVAEERVGETEVRWVGPEWLGGDVVEI
jgi:uncharacterized protein